MSVSRFSVKHGTQMTVGKPEKSVFKMTFELNVPVELGEEWAYTYLINEVENTIVDKLSNLSKELDIEFEEIKDYD